MPINPLTIGSLFNFKDKLTCNMRSGVIYLCNCPKCILGTGTSVGCTERMLRVRVAGYLGYSHRTGEPVQVKKNQPSVSMHCPVVF